MDGKHETNGHGPAGLFERTREEGRFFWSEVVDIRGDLQELAAKEVELLGAEITEQVRHAARAAMFGAFAAVCGLIFLSFLFVSVMFGLAEVFQLWAAALITTGIIAVVLAIVGALAYSQVRAFSFIPKRTINSLKEDAEWARNLVTSSKKSQPSEKPFPGR